MIGKRMTMEKQKAYLWLSLGQLTHKKAQALMDLAGGIERLYTEFENIATTRAFLSLKISDEKRAILQRFRDNDYLQARLSALDKMGVQVLDCESEAYPEALHNVDSPPLVLYAKGDVQLLKSPCVAVVGTRHCTRYGQESTKRIARDLCDCGVTVVSGLATGIDTYAHTETLEQKGKTIAVLGGGFLRISPSSNTNLAKQVAAFGLLLSEYPPESESLSFMFVMRNRIVAGISEGVVVVESGIKSGANITANMALENGKTVFCVPGNINSPQSMGTNAMIKEGATLVTNGFEIAETLGFAKKNNAKECKMTPLALDFFEQKVYNLLQMGKTHFDILIEKMECSVRELTVILSTMEIKGIVQKLPSNFYALTNQK